MNNTETHKDIDGHTNQQNQKTQLGLFIVLGIFFWIAGLLSIRYLDKICFSKGNPLLILAFILAVPLTYLVAYLAKRVGKLKGNQVLESVVIMSFTACILDGIALTQFSELYSQSQEVLFCGEAWLLWGIGIILIWGYFLSKSLSPSP